MPAYPLFFSFTNTVRGTHFTATIKARGRVLMDFDDGDWWLTGVEAGGIADCGPMPNEAFTTFRVAFQRTLEQLAADASTFAEFESHAREFFADVNRTAEGQWKLALEERRAGSKTLEDPFKAVTELPAESVNVGIEIRYQESTVEAFAEVQLGLAA